MGFPVKIDHPKYPRNALIFNLCFVFEKKENAACYQQVVRKMARLLYSLEVESELLSQTQSGLLNIMEQILDDMNSYHECQIYISSHG